mgnify:CR=1 FL=1
MRNFHQHGIDTRGRISGKIKIICPQCNDTRGHKGNKSLSVDLDKGATATTAATSSTCPTTPKNASSSNAATCTGSPPHRPSTSAVPPSTLPGCNSPRTWNATGPPSAACRRSCCAGNPPATTMINCWNAQKSFCMFRDIKKCRCFISGATALNLSAKTPGP